MIKNYFLILIFAFAFLFGTHNTEAQNINSEPPVQEKIDGLSIYPNPVNSERTFIYVTSRSNSDKQIEFFNVLGKQIYATKLIGKQLNITNLSKGVYILKITENGISETRKLVIK